MIEIGKIKLNKALCLAPMEDISDRAFRRLCKEFGADIVYTEFVNSDGLIRNNKKTRDKFILNDYERPIGIQIYGSNIEAMTESAKIVEEEQPELIDINAGCWVKKVAGRGAGAGLLKDPAYMQEMVESVVKSVKTPVTVKTRLGWDENSILILEVAKRIEDAGARALTIHCRTRKQAHNGTADWSWVNRIKEVIKIPVILNGGIYQASDVSEAFETTAADGVMIARGAINHPWIFREAKDLMLKGIEPPRLQADERISTALKHLRYSMEIREERYAVITFRKYYAGYLKGLFNASSVKRELMNHTAYSDVEDTLLEYLEDLKNNSPMLDTT